VGCRGFQVWPQRLVQPQASYLNPVQATPRFLNEDENFWRRRLPSIWSHSTLEIARSGNCATQSVCSFFVAENLRCGDMVLLRVSPTLLQERKSIRLSAT